MRSSRYGKLGNLDRVFLAHVRTLDGVPVGSGQAASGGAKRSRNSADLAAESESVVLHVPQEMSHPRPKLAAYESKPVSASTPYSSGIRC